MDSGFLPESFFEEEVRCDFMVTKERKKIWAIELDLLRELDRVCKKYNLVYVLYCGSLLGAVRHKGFILWDNDLDSLLVMQNIRIIYKMKDKTRYKKGSTIFI